MSIINRLKSNPDPATIADAVRALEQMQSALSIYDAMTRDYVSDESGIADRAARAMSDDVSAGGTAKHVLKSHGLDVLSMRSDTDIYEVQT